IGWKAVENLRPGEKAIGRDGKPTKITGVYPHEIRQMYRVTLSDGVTIDTDANHLWSVRPHGRKYQDTKQPQWIVKSTGELYGNLKTPNGTRRYEIPMLDCPAEFDVHPELPIDPYLLGALLGDGNIRQRSTIAITTEKDIVKMLPIPEGCAFR